MLLLCLQTIHHVIYIVIFTFNGGFSPKFFGKATGKSLTSCKVMPCGFYKHSPHLRVVFFVKTLREVTDYLW